MYTQGHLLIGTERIRAGELKTWIVPAIYSENGLAMHRDVVNGYHNKWTVTHVSSGLALRNGLKQREAKNLLDALASEDWTFSSDRVTADHAERVREIVG